MARISNRHHLLAVKLLELRRHFNSCQQCRSARVGRDFSFMCGPAQDLLIEIAVKWEANIPGRLAAIRSKETTVFPCPDPNAHGPAYAITAEAVYVTDVAERLF
jgi:hypothetical protein